MRVRTREINRVSAARRVNVEVDKGRNSLRTAYTDRADIARHGAVDRNPTINARVAEQRDALSERYVFGVTARHNINGGTHPIRDGLIYRRLY